VYLWFCFLLEKTVFRSIFSSMSKVTIQLISLFACTKVVVVITTITGRS
jgi:hypothetical protein